MSQVTDPEWQEFAIMNDELDEQEGNGPAADGYPVTFIVSLITRWIVGFSMNPDPLQLC